MTARSSWPSSLLTTRDRTASHATTARCSRTGSTALVALLLPATLGPQLGLDDARDLVLPGWAHALLAIGVVAFGTVGAKIPMTASAAAVARGHLRRRG